MDIPEKSESLKESIETLKSMYENSKDKEIKEAIKIHIERLIKLQKSSIGKIIDLSNEEL